MKHTKIGFPRFYAAASLKLLNHFAAVSISSGRFSAVLCRGLIEAVFLRSFWWTSPIGFPRFYAAASLKHTAGARLRTPATGGFPRFYAAASLKHRPGERLRARERAGFSAVLCRGLIEASTRTCRPRVAGVRFSAVLCRGLIEAPGAPGASGGLPGGFSAVLCRGLIEAKTATGEVVRVLVGFPRFYAAASLKRLLQGQPSLARWTVFRGFMPRPH